MDQFSNLDRQEENLVFHLLQLPVLQEQFFLIFSLIKSSTALATARKVLPVPDGPTPKVKSAHAIFVKIFFLIF